MIDRATRAALLFLREMARKNFNDPGHAHFLTFTCYRRKQLLTSDRAREYLAHSLSNAGDKHEFALWAYVFMPEHVHLLLHPRNEIYSIAEILRDIKGPFSRAFSKYLKEKNPIRLRSLKVVIGEREYYRVWQAGGGFDRNLHSPVLLRRAVEYIEWNPVRRRLVRDPLEWKWSSARWRAGNYDGLIPLEAPGWLE